MINTNTIVGTKRTNPNPENNFKNQFH
jgi:hypothetical protein